VLELGRSAVAAALVALLESSGREAEERAGQSSRSLGTLLAFAKGYGVFEPIEALLQEAFALSETTRGVALASAALARGGSAAPEYQELCARLREAGQALAALAQKGGTSEEYHSARARREAAERELAQLARELVGEEFAALHLDVEALGARLGEREALVGFRRYTRWWLEAADAMPESGETSLRRSSLESLGAFVLRAADEAGEPRLAFVELGPIEAIEPAVRGWRAAIAAEVERGISLDDTGRSREIEIGRELRRAVWDPLLAHLVGAETVIVALDDVLHLVPLEALPLDGERVLVGERWRIETRVALWEVLGSAPESPRGGALVTLGGASFNSRGVALAEAELAVLEADDEPQPRATPVLASLLRGGAWERGFAPLTYSGTEAREVAALFEEVQEDDARTLVLEGRRASRAALEEAAPKARWLHVATHGWFAPESIRSWEDLDEGPRTAGLALRAGAEEVVRGMSPMLICGLAFAGANLPADSLGRVPGLMTAEELSTLDLTGCELAVLSACDTLVGERRAGQGVASLQKALHVAGVRSAITSLWKVPDEATCELMLDFYRRLWVEKKPKARALWEAKQRLREAKDETGRPRYTTRDWAAWVLTGEPD
jgi:CHAT domain-containing protein